MDEKNGTNDVVVVDETPPVVEPEVEETPKLDDISTLKMLEEMALRSELGKTERKPLLYLADGGRWVTIPDENYYIVFNDAPAPAIDAFRDALEQYKQTPDYEMDKESGEVVGTVNVERQTRMWPVIEVLLNYKLIDEAVLPQKLKGQPGVVPYKWKGSKHLDRQALERSGILTVAMIVHMATAHILGDDEVVGALGE